MLRQTALALHPIERILTIFNVEPPIDDNIGNEILQIWIRFGIHELFIVSKHYPLLIPMVYLLVPIGTSRLLIIPLFHIFGFITT